MAVEVSEGLFEGQPAITLLSAAARLVILPQISGKIASLTDTRGREILWRNPHRPYQQPVYGHAFSEYDTSGWEDCLPTVAASLYPAWPWKDIPLPEHGEVWAVPWEAQIVEGAVEVAAQGVRLPYRLEKRISLQENRIRVSHRLSNPSAFPIHYLWATHPLFAVRPGMRIVLPEGVRVRVDWASEGYLGPYLEELSWPEAIDAGGQRARLDQIDAPDLGRAAKLYTTRVSQGWCGLYDPADRHAIALRFDPAQLPYVGVWINQGGWPAEGPRSCNVALEPTNGYPDLLQVAHARGSTGVIGAGEEQSWEIELRFGPADSVPALLDA